KLRGFRIELGEIEAALTKHEAVGEAVVVLHESEGNKSLAAYLTVFGGSETDTAALSTDLRAFLKESLPEYMVPSSFTLLEQLPLTPNGKIDRKALPAPEIESRSTGTRPQTPTEELLAGVWADLLKCQTVHQEDNFFELGGHSLLATSRFAGA
ncbi:MAG: hypothetical protein D3916_16490, partial [Candidatus Electrothrix sp. MAN1_4]|nr:hypothetical protein [Candidatus Electrothrix sp. MAN1_4]